MQLNTNLFFDVLLGKDISNFLDTKDLLSFYMVESSGLTLPILELSFKTLSTSIKDKIIENNPIQVKIGHSSSTSDTFTISTVAKKVESISDGYYMCHIYGFLSDKKFLTDKFIKAVRGTSLEGIQEVGNEYFNEVTTDIENEDVKELPMNWLITNESNQVLMSDMWLHMNISPSFPMIAVTRYGNLILKDFNKLKKSESKYTFVQKTTGDSKEIVFLNNFCPDNNTHVYNMYAGYGKVVNIFNSNTGEYSVFVNSADPNMIATSQEVETSDSGNYTHDGFVISDNVHEKYYQSYFYNTSKLLQLSNICGKLQYKGRYERELNLLDLVNVQPTESEKYATLSGKYIIDTIEYKLTAQTPFTTSVYVSRDSLNHVENNIINPPSIAKIPSNIKEDLLVQIKCVRELTSLLKSYLGDDSINNVLSYLNNLKSSVIGSFSDSSLSSMLEQITSINQLKSSGVKIILQVLNNFLPTDVIELLRMQSIEGIDLTSLITSYAPIDYQPYIQTIIMSVQDILSLLEETKNTVNNTAISSGLFSQSTKTSELQGNSMLESSNISGLDTVTTIINNIKDNIKGLDIPIPLITLTESQSLYSITQLNTYIVDETINNLVTLGYLTNINIDDFKDILLGNEVLDSNTIETVNTNIGSVLYTRYWGSYSNLDDLTDFYIRQSYTDKFKTVPCTKIVDASRGKHIFVALPEVKTGVTFYINNVLTNMNYFTTTLGEFDFSGNLINYTVYYSSGVYNSNSTSVECRQ